MYAIITSDSETITGKRMVLSGNIKNIALRRQAAQTLFTLRARHRRYNRIYPSDAGLRQSRARDLHHLCEGALFALEQLDTTLSLKDMGVGLPAWLHGARPAAAEGETR